MVPGTPLCEALFDGGRDVEDERGGTRLVTRAKKARSDLRGGQGRVPRRPMPRDGVVATMRVRDGSGSEGGMEVGEVDMVGCERFQKKKENCMNIEVKGRIGQSIGVKFVILTIHLSRHCFYHPHPWPLLDPSPQASTPLGCCSEVLLVLQQPS